MNDMANTNPEQLDTPVENVSREDLTEAVRATALLADLTVSIWSGERTDRELGTRIKEDAGAIGNTGRYLKNLMAGCDTQLREVRGAYTGARHVHYKLTLPWVNNPQADRQTGPRLLPNMLFERYLTEMSKLKREANEQLDRFVGIYPDLILRAQANLGGLAKAEDYPTQEEVRQLFKLSFDFTPIPAATAFTGLPDGMIERLGAQLRRRQEAAVAASQAAMWERVRETVGHMVDRLDGSNDDGSPKVFKAGTVDSVRELVTTLPGFNCAGDPRVTTVVNDIEQMLRDVSPEQLRKNAGVRDDVVRQAQAISSKLDKWGL